MQASKPASRRRPPGHEHPVSHRCANHGDPHLAVPLAPIAATHRRGLDRYDFDSVLLPYNFDTMQYCACRESRPWLWPAELLSLPSGRDDHRSCACGSCSS